MLISPHTSHLFGALSMGMKPGNDEEKSQLVAEICNVSARAVACAEFHHPRAKKSLFINWYLVLRVDENADIDGIRKQYHKLALQLHPDKNKHSKAETAFKLVSEAYSCLSDKARRAAFDAERKTIIPCTFCSIHPHHIPTQLPQQIIPPRKAYRIQKTRMRELRTKLKEEAMIINKCLIVNSTASAPAARTSTETPVFDPSNYKQNKEYPHSRTVINQRKLEDMKAAFIIGNRCSMFNMTKNNSSPIFQCRSERESFMSRCASAAEH